MTQSTKKSILTTRELTSIALLAAVAAVLFIIPGVPIFPMIPFYKLDFSNLPVLLGTFAFGPVRGTLILLIKSTLGLLSTTSGGVGELADFIMGFAMIIPAGLIYKQRKSRYSALIGMLVGTVCAVIASMLSNYYILLPFFGLTEEMAISMGSKLFPFIDSTWSFVIFVTGAFNLIKFVVISIAGFFIYKPLSPILHGRKKRITEAK